MGRKGGMGGKGGMVGKGRKFEMGGKIGNGRNLRDVSMTMDMYLTIWATTHTALQSLNHVLDW